MEAPAAVRTDGDCVVATATTGMPAATPALIPAKALQPKSDIQHTSLVPRHLTKHEPANAAGTLSCL